MMEVPEINKLLQKFRENRCTPEELATIEEWYARFDEEAEHIPSVPEEKLKFLYDEIQKRIETGKSRYLFIRQTLKYVAGIAAVLALVWIGKYSLENTGIETYEAEVIAPGHVQAELTFADGVKVALDSSSVIKDENGVVIKSEACPILDYTLLASAFSQAENHMISVPLGGEYKVILSDGTQVWLNSGSSLKYPVGFEGDKREVILTGEGYFKVAKSEIPFIVKTTGMDIKVLGTSFNVSAYAEDFSVTTTLVEGKVKVYTHENNREYEMQPGYMLSYEKETDRVSLEECDTELYTSWTQGKFKFRDMRLEDIMIKLNRWYNCEFFYQNAALRDLRFSGAAEKDRPVDYLLEMIETVTDVHFEIKGKTVVLQQK